MQAPPLSSRAALQRYAEALKAAPLGIFDADAQRYRPIPASLQALILADAPWAATAADCQLCLNALEQVWQHLRQPPEAKRARQILARLSPLEARAAWEAQPPRLATVRFDLFFKGEELKIVEINTTIPAMQAYSDMVRAAYVLALGHSPSSPAPAIASNVDALLSSLLALHPLARGAHIAIVAREHDSQQAELLWIKNRWRARGYRVSLLLPSSIEMRGNHLVHAGETIDLVYRHIFASRLDPASAFAQACLQPEVFPIYNPISAQLEVKGLLAELSRLAADEASASQAGLSAEAVAAVQRRVPWTRLLIRGPARGPQGEDWPDLISELQQQAGEDYVVKANSGYGGLGVVIGSRLAEPSVQLQVKSMMNLEPSAPAVSWHAFLDFCASSRELFIVQQRIEGRTCSHSYLVGDAIQSGAKDYLDLSLFGSSIGSRQVPVGVSRFAADPIVNLGRGGGLIPVFTESEALELGMIPAP